MSKTQDKLCCLINSDWICLGCKVVTCATCSNLQKPCKATYTNSWARSAEGHAWIFATNEVEKYTP